MNSSAGKQGVQCYIGDTPRPTCNSTELNEEKGEEESKESTFCFCHTVPASLKTSLTGFIEKLVMMIQLKMFMMASCTKCFQVVMVF